MWKMEQQKENLKNLHRNLNNEQIDYYLEIARQTVLSLTNRKELLEEMKMLVTQLASFYVVQSNNQGVTSRSEGAISESYTDTNVIPMYLLNQILNYRLLRRVQH